VLSEDVVAAFNIPDRVIATIAANEEEELLFASIKERLDRWGWVVRVEVTFNRFGDRGRIDLLAWNPRLAILLVVFDVEAMFLFPWAVVLKEIGLVGYVEMFVFMLLLLVGFAYAWLKGALEWEE
jgi:hypothetical protein